MLDLDDVDEPEDDDTLVTAPAMKTQARFEKNLAESMADAAFDVFCNRKIPEKVLIMDTQGAWDSRMTKEQSATVRGRLEVLDTHGTPRALHATRNAWNALDTTLNAPKRPHCAHKRAG